MDLRQFVSQTHQRIEEIESQLSERREEDRMKYRLRFGLREKKDFPWPGAANYSLRLADKLIRKLKPHYMALVSGVDEEKADVLFTPGLDEERAKKTRHVINYILNYGLPEYERTMWVAIDKAMMYDYCVLAPYWLRRTERRTVTLDLARLVSQGRLPSPGAGPSAPSPQGAGAAGEPQPGPEERVRQALLLILDERGVTLDPDDPAEAAALETVVKAALSGAPEAELEAETVVENRNALRVLDPMDFVLAPGTRDLQSADLVCEKMYFTAPELRSLVRAQRFNPAAVDEALSKAGRRTASGGQAPGVSSTGSQRDDGRREDLDCLVPELVQVRKVCCWADPEESGSPRRCVLYYCPDSPGEPLGLHLLDGQKWPYVQVRLEVTDEGFYSPRGLVSMVGVFERIINSQFNDMMNRRLITTTPMLTHVAGKVLIPNIRYVPGQSIPVKEQGAVQPLSLGINADAAYEQGLIFVRAWAEDFIGVPDYALAQNAAGTARTASEVQLIAGLKDVMVEMDARVFNRCVEELFEFLYQDWLRHADGGLALEIDGRPQLLGPDDLLPGPRFRALATFARVNRDMQRQEAVTRYQLFNNDPLIDQAELRRQVLRAFGDGLAGRLMPASAGTPAAGRPATPEGGQGRGPASVLS